MNPDALAQQGVLHRIDHAFAAMIQRVDGSGDPWLALAAGLVSRAAADGDVCLDLETIVKEGIRNSDGSRRIPVNISLKRWRQVLSGSSVVGTVNEKKPMILDGNLLYLQRYWNYENIVAQAIRERCRSHIPVYEMPDGEEMLTGARSDNELQDPDQADAVCGALGRRFMVISGGPGTGKTTTIARIIATLRHLYGDATPRIMLAAPTGKAAARMQEALHQGMRHLLKNHPADPSDRPIEAKTLHRLLGIMPGRHQSRFSGKNPLSADVVIVDEASMIDLSLMARLIEAVPLDARLILVGDKDQLSSVEAGSVLGDICAGISAIDTKKSRRNVKDGHGIPLSEHMVVLQKSYRFSSGSGIDELGKAINEGNSQRVLELLTDSSKDQIDFRSIDAFGDIEDTLPQLVMESISPILTSKDLSSALAHLEQVKILTPLRKGPFGVASINQLVETTLRKNGLIHPAPGWEAQWYTGRPVIMNRNDYYHHLFNGDVGITIVDRSDGQHQVRIGFSDGLGQIRYLAPDQLPDHETVYAMTVHKSQGTEFQKVVLILPDRDSPLLTRELIYTAVTRARRRVEIWGRHDVLSAAVERQIHRASGLRKKLWQL